MGTVSHAYLASCPVILDSDGDGAFTHRDLAIAPRAVSLSADHGRFRAVAWGILRAPVLMPCPSTSGTFADRCQGCNDTATGLPPAFPFLSSWVAVEAAPPQPSPAPTASPAPSPDAGGDAVEPTDTPVPGTETPGTGTVTPPEPDGVATPAAQEDVVVDTATPNPTSMIDPNAVRAVEALHDMHRHLLLGPLSTAVTEIVLRSRLSSTDETSWWSEAQATVAAASCLGGSRDLLNCCTRGLRY